MTPLVIIRRVLAKLRWCAENGSDLRPFTVSLDHRECISLLVHLAKWKRDARK